MGSIPTASTIFKTALRSLDQLQDLQGGFGFKGHRGESQDYLRFAQAQFKYGLVDYLIVIDSERTLLANQLIKALGGGWNPTENRDPR